MTSGRLAAFSDGVVAILITILVLELKIPHGASWGDLRPLAPTFLTYVMSFIYLAIYWNNHHHLLHTVERVDGRILWANTHLLFWLSLVPFTTGWMGENHFAAAPVVLYGAVLLFSSIAFSLLVTAIIKRQGANSKLARAVKGDFKGKLSIGIYLVAIPLAFVQQWLAEALYVAVALIWLVPDPRIESRLGD